jgi:GDPmannose 4,6-dehydratase
MLQQPKADDYVVATGETHSVRDFCEAAFSHVGLNYQDHVKVDNQFFRPAEVDLLIGDASHARKTLRWSNRIGFRDLVSEMVEADLKLIRDEGAA